jgi:AraC-like DNA-binding protein
MTTTSQLSLLSHPYDRLVPLTGGRKEMRAAARIPGSALIWSMAEGNYAKTRPTVEGRPGGLALIAILPRTDVIVAHPDVIHSVQQCRPNGLLPYHAAPVPGDLAQVLRRPASDLPADITDYLTWRGLIVDRETTHLIRRIIELSAELHSITSLARGLYMSRRALGRRLRTRGLPVPSHWLQLSRMLRLASRLQNSDASVFTTAYEFGYPDGFSVSNQMYRLIGYRPSHVREYLGWEWILEAWLRKEAETGGLGIIATQEIREGAKSTPASLDVLPTLRRGRVGNRRRSVA